VNGEDILLRSCGLDLEGYRIAVVVAKAEDLGDFVGEGTFYVSVRSPVTL
jgi:hypothetical protein